MKVLLTGASGHLGANLVRRLISDGHRVRVLLQEGTNNEGVDGLDVERLYGDLRDIDATRRATHGIERIYHAAAKISTLDHEANDIFTCNVIGTRNLLRSALENGCGRVVMTSSFSAIGRTPGRPSTEDEPFNVFAKATPYEKSKSAAEHECLKAVANGLDVVIAVSCAILGPHDYLPSRLGATSLRISRGEVKAYPAGGFEFVAARDIVEGHILAMEKGRTGHKYIIASGYRDMGDIVGVIAKATGQRPPRSAPLPLMKLLAEFNQLAGKTFFPSMQSRVTPLAVRILNERRSADTTKARTELGFVPTSIEDAIHEALEHFAQRGLIKGAVYR
jgi:nucleoside-diphosphate-sugar epimerase